MTYDPNDPALAAARAGEPIPAKKKPRGRPFQRGNDPRRNTDPNTLPSMASAPAALPGSLDAIIEGIARRAAATAVNEDGVRAITRDMLDAYDVGVNDRDAALREYTDSAIARIASSAPRDITVTVNTLPTVTLDETPHVALARVIALAVARFNILLVGPAGCGKTTLGGQLARCLSLGFGDTSCAPGLPESALVGRLIPNLTTGTDNYRSAPFVDAYANGGVYLLDEVDNADASTLLVLNSALANGHLTLPSGERVARHPDFILIASANTYGHGQSREYVGRTQLDAAFLDRFVGATVTLDYDETLERALCPETEIRDAVLAVRTKARALKLRRIVSTRGMLHVRRLVTQCGDSVRDALHALTEGWTAEDRSAVGVA